MKIDEPKTPYAKHYDPAEDEDEVGMLDTDQIVVDELDRVQQQRKRSPGKNTRAKAEEIPDLSLGEPEEAIPEGEFDEDYEARRERAKVHVNGEDHVGLSKEEREKHRRFEEMRKKHYEMKNVVNLLGHPEEIDALVDEDEDEEMNGNAR